MPTRVPEGHHRRGRHNGDQGTKLGEIEIFDKPYEVGIGELKGS